MGFIFYNLDFLMHELLTIMWQFQSEERNASQIFFNYYVLCFCMENYNNKYCKKMKYVWVNFDIDTNLMNGKWKRITNYAVTNENNHKKLKFDRIEKIN